MRKLSILFLIIALPFLSSSQTLKGKLYDATTTIKGAKVYNKTQHSITTTDVNGNFSIIAKVNDTLVFKDNEEFLGAKEAVIATGSLRRRAQLLTLRPDLKFCLLRGNVGTRLSATAVASAAPRALRGPSPSCHATSHCAANGRPVRTPGGRGAKARTRGLLYAEPRAQPHQRAQVALTGRVRRDAEDRGGLVDDPHLSV